MKIICFGDSNTMGYDPRGYFGGCYDAPWPEVLAEMSGWSVRNDGEPGREIPGYQLNFPKDVDLLAVMLGTNDLLQGNPPEIIMNRMKFFLEQTDIERSKILLIGPPSMKLGAWVPAQGLIEASKELNIAYQALSQRLGVHFVNADLWGVSMAFDGVHFTERGHKTFAIGLYEYLKKEVCNYVS